MTRDIQKQDERRVLDRVLRALGVPPDSEPEGGESPDFTVGLRGQSVGVEITIYRSGEVIEGSVKRRAAESEWESLRAVAQNFWKQQGDLRAASVGVMFKGCVTHHRERQAFLQEVATFVRQHLAELTREHRDFFPSSSSPLMHRDLERLVLRTDPCAEWHSNFSRGYVARPNGGNISNIVTSKSKKEFRPTDELWLVIHCGTRMSEMTLELDGVEDFRSIQGLDRSKFARVFVLTYTGTYEWSRTTDNWRQL
jgi:hypothetical protein